MRSILCSFIFHGRNLHSSQIGLWIVNTGFGWQIDIMVCIGQKLSGEETQLYIALTLFQTWWRHQMETFSALLAICAGNSPVPGEFPTQRPVTRSFDVYSDLRPNKRLSKQSLGRWFETLSPPLWRHRNVIDKFDSTHDHPPVLGPATKLQNQEQFQYKISLILEAARLVI